MVFQKSLGISTYVAMELDYCYTYLSSTVQIHLDWLIIP